MSHHTSKGFWEMISKARELGCQVVESKNGVRVIPKDRSIPAYNCHAGERGLHPLRRFLKNRCKLEV